MQDKFPERAIRKQDDSVEQNLKSLLEMILVYLTLKLGRKYQCSPQKQYVSRYAA